MTGGRGGCRGRQDQHIDVIERQLTNRSSVRLDVVDVLAEICQRRRSVAHRVTHALDCRDRFVKRVRYLIVHLAIVGHANAKPSLACEGSTPGGYPADGIFLGERLKNKSCIPWPVAATALPHRSLRALIPTLSLRGEELFRPRAGMRPRPDASPQPWHEPVADVARVVDVALQLATEHRLLVDDAQHQERRVEEQEQQPPVRAERQRQTDHHDQDADIHWVPHQRVRAGGNHALAVHPLDR
jgi:hypothetical protein